MPVNPPYQIIDTIARLRASGGAAWGDAAKSIGQSVGGGIAQAGQNDRATKAAAGKAQADRYHDATMFADKNFDWSHVPPPQAGGAAPGGAPSGILQPAQPAMGGGSMGNLPVPPTAASGYQPAWTRPGAPGTTAPAPAPAASRAPGSVTMNDIYLAHGLKPVAGGDTIIGTSRQQDKEQAADTLQKTKNAGAAETAAGKEKSAADTAHSKYFTPVDDTLRAMAKHNGTPIGDDEKEVSKQTADAISKKFIADTNVAGRKDTAKTSADAKTGAAAITAAGRKQIAEINARLKSPDNQIKLQAMKDRDAYITKNPAAAKLMGLPDDLGKTPDAAPAPKPAAGGDGTDLDALMAKHGGQ